MTPPFENLPRRIFLDSCTVQTLRNYGGYIFDGESIANTDRIHRVTEGFANVEALRNIFLINQRASFEWIVSNNSLMEAQAKRDPGHIQWLLEIAHHSEICLLDDGPSVESRALAARLSEQKFGYLSDKDRWLLRDAVLLGCEAFLTVERRRPQNADHVQRELGIIVLTPTTHWTWLRPWARLWR